MRRIRVIVRVRQNKKPTFDADGVDGRLSGALLTYTVGHLNGGNGR